MSASANERLMRRSTFTVYRAGRLGDDIGRRVSGLVYGAGHGTPPPSLGGVAASGGRFLRADLKNSKIVLVPLRLLDARIATGAEDSRVHSYRKRLFCR